jgi:hypothetical protein
MTDRSFTPKEFLDWAETKDPTERYQYDDPWNCPVAQFCIETGRYKRPSVGPGDVHEGGDLYASPTTFKFSNAIEHSLNPPLSKYVGHFTFGALVKRLREKI